MGDWGRTSTSDCGVGEKLSAAEEEEQCTLCSIGNGGTWDKPASSSPPPAFRAQGNVVLLECLSDNAFLWRLPFYHGHRSPVEEIAGRMLQSLCKEVWVLTKGASSYECI